MQDPLAAHLTDGVVRNAAFTNRPPSPPYIHIPTPLAAENTETPRLTPSYDSVDPSMLTPEDLKIITGGRAQHAVDLQKTTWRYEDRRKAQAVTDFLYLGPLAAVRDLDFLREEGITMLLAVQDVAMANLRIMTIDKAVSALNLEVHYLNIENKQQFIQALPDTINKINDHLLRVYKSQLHTVDASGGAAKAIDPSTFRRGKVLMFCETGNDRGAAVAVAYLMAMYGTEMVNAVQFISCQRFCVILDEPTKYMLQAFGDILDAQKMIARQQRQANLQGDIREDIREDQREDQQQAMLPTTAKSPPPPKKRGFEETMDPEDDGEFAMDLDRFEDRPAFVPYRQESTDITMG